MSASKNSLGFARAAATIAAAIIAAVIIAVAILAASAAAGSAVAPGQRSVEDRRSGPDSRIVLENDEMDLDDRNDDPSEIVQLQLDA